MLCLTFFTSECPTKRAPISRMSILSLLRVLSLLHTWRTKIKARRKKVSPMYSADASPSDSPLPSTTIPYKRLDYCELARQLLPLLPATCNRLESDDVLIADTSPFSSGSFSEIWQASLGGLPVAVKSLRCYCSPEFDPTEVGVVGCLPMSAIETVLTA